MDFLKKISLYLLAFSLTFAIFNAFSAEKNSIVGYWQTIDQKTNNPSTLIHIYKSNGKYYGKIVKIYPGDGRNPNKKCTKCKGDLKNKPVVGMIMIRDMVKKGDKYIDGKIMDPRSGEEYKCVIKLGDDGKKLYVRGYLGFSLLGKTSVWQKAPDQSGKEDQTNKSTQSSGQQNSQTPSNQTDQSGQTDQSNQSGQTDQSNQSGQQNPQMPPGQPGQPVQPNPENPQMPPSQPGQTGQPGNPS